MISLAEILKEAAAQQFSDKALAQVHQLLKTSSYPAFVKKLQGMAGNNEIRAILKNGRFDGLVNDEKISVSLTSIPVVNIHPTQNEIDITKSLSWQLSGRGQVLQLLSGGSVTLGIPIISLNKKYAIDGHHRWSQAYCINYKSSISAMDMKMAGDHVKALKAVQIAIAIEKGGIETKGAKGLNLLKTSEGPVVDYVVKEIVDKVVQDFLNHDTFRKWALSNSDHGKPGVLDTMDDKIKKQEVGRYIWMNVSMMQSKSNASSPAFDRALMPQTDDAPSWTKTAQAADINYSEPITAQEAFDRFRTLSEIKKRY